MRINKVQTNNTTVQFKAEIVDSSSLRKLRAGLSTDENKILASYIKTIKESKNRNSYIFDYITLCSKPKDRIIASISVQNKDKTIQQPPVFAESANNALKVFKNLAEALTKTIK